MKVLFTVFALLCMLGCLVSAQNEQDYPPFANCLVMDVWNRCIECPEGYGSNGKFCPRKCLKNEGCQCDYSCQYLNENDVCVLQAFKPYVGP